MKNLIIKDLKGAKWTLIAYSILLCFIYLPLLNKNAPIVKDYKESVFDFFTNLNLFYFSSLFLMIAINFIIIRNTNKKSNTNKLLRSLPIMTKSIIGSVFIEPILLFLTFILVGLGINTIFSLFIGTHTKISLGILIITFIMFYIYASTMLALALVYPESSVVSYLRSVPMFLLIIIVALFDKLIKNLNINIDIFDRYIPLAIGILFIIGILITIFMYKFSINKFLAKDL
ncbi:ABC-2 transporter permease [Clostridium perfringens]|uniref:ABC-2 transporter permease n=1 Tax=Clostridium perfringens TaxID=1502 RepID=UPI001F3877AD|nr:ABC-2 transporter permease [Clostridium perfringens]MCF2686791.1 ABC-2 transporter permease [Clostridium perfringens]